MWAFMALGQLVAISVAANLSFILVLLARQQPEFSHANTKMANRGFGSHVVAVVSFACAALTRWSHGDHRFLIILLVPHITAFLPLTAWLKPDTSTYYTVAFLATSLLAHTTWRAMASGHTIADFGVALYEYPAVSSAGWDVIMCWISFTAWALLN